MPRRLNCYVVIITLVWGIFVIPPFHQAKAENEEQIPDLFKRNMTRNDFSNLLHSLIKLNEQRLVLVNKLSKLEDYGVINEVLRSGQNKSDNADLQNVYLIILNQNRSNPSRRNMGEQVMEQIPSPVIANKLQKRSTDSLLKPDSNPLVGTPTIESQKALDPAENTKINLRTKNRYEIDDGSHSFSTLNPYHDLEAELLDSKQFMSSEDETDEDHKSTTPPPKVSIQIKMDPNKEQDRFEIVTNTNTSDYEDETNGDSSKVTDMSSEYSDSDLSSENERNSKIMKIRDVFSNDKDDKLFMSGENVESIRGFNNVANKDLFKNSEVLTKNKPVSIETYSEVTEDTKYNTHDKIIRKKEYAYEEPHYIDQTPLLTKEGTDEYSQPKLSGDSSERGHSYVNVKKDTSVEVHSYKRPKQIEEHSDEYDHRIKHHIDEVKSIEKYTPSKTSNVNSDHYKDDDHRISVEKSYEKDYSKEHNGYSKYSNEIKHRISLNSKNHKLSEEDEVNKYSNKHKEYSKEVGHKTKMNSNKSSEKEYSNKQPKRISGHSSDDDHRMSDKSNEQNLNKKPTNNNNKHSQTNSDHFNENDHRISLDDYANNQNNKLKSSMRYSDENDHRINRDDNKSYEKEIITKHKSSSKLSGTSVEVDRSYGRPKQIDEYSHSNKKPKFVERDSSEKGHNNVNLKKDISVEVDHSYRRPKQIEEHSDEHYHHQLDKNKSYEKGQPNKHNPSSTQSSEEVHKIKDENKSYEKRVAINKPKTGLKSFEDLTDHKSKKYLNNDKSNEDDGHKSYKDDPQRSGENSHRINVDKKNENDHNYKNTKINRDDSKELEPHGNSYSKPNKDAPLDSRMSYETSPRTFDKTSKYLPNKSEGDDKKFFEDDHGDKQTERGKDYGGEDYHSSEDYGQGADSRGVLRGKSQEVKHSKHSPEVAEHGSGTKPQALRKNFQKCIGKKATKLCTKSCISAYKNVCKKVKCSSKSKKALKQECKRTCRLKFATRKSNKYSDESS